MSRYRKIVWTEGMLLAPHHFQQWDNYYEELLNERLASLVAYGWGVLDIQVNQAAVANGTFELERCRAVMPDGLRLEVPQVDPAPDARSFEERFDADAESLDVHLAIPVKRADEMNFHGTDRDDGWRVRYGLTPASVLDETTGENRRELAFARSNLRLLFGDEPRDGYSSIRIARLERKPTGQFAFAEEYIPPALSIAASAWLVRMLRQFVEILTAKSGSLSGRRGQRGGSALADLNTLGTANFWLLHTINSTLPSLSHLLNVQRTQPVHPEDLYSKLIRLAGELMTFTTDYQPKDIVPYEHKELHATFSQLDAQLRHLLETVIPTRWVRIDLVKVSETVYHGRIDDARLLDDADFYLGVHAKVSESHLIDYVPTLVKVAAQDDVEGVISRSVSAVKLRHVSPPPDPIPTRGGAHYFKLEQAGRYWKAIQGAKALAVYVPTDEFPEEQVELYAIKH